MPRPQATYQRVFDNLKPNSRNGNRSQSRHPSQANATATSWLLLMVLLALSVSHSVSASSNHNKRKVVVAVDGGTESIRACCFDAENGSVLGEFCAAAYPTSHPQPGWAEQSPDDWYRELGRAVRGAVNSVRLSLSHEQGYADGDGSLEVAAICIDTTCCSVVALGGDSKPLRPALLWMDARSAAQTREIMEKCRGDPALNVNCGGEGPLSAEWMTPKALWIRQNEPETWQRAHTICEYQDYLNLQLTGQIVASSCNAATRWHWDGELCIKDGNEHEPYPGRPLSMYKALGIPELADKLPKKCLSMGSVVGHLTKAAASHLDLPEGIPVVQGGPDAFVGMIGLGCIRPGQLCLITGSSHLHCMVTSKPTTAPGMWGAYRGAPLPSLNFAEGGQSSTGSIIRWTKNKLFEEINDSGSELQLSYQDLDSQAACIAPGCDGLVAVETFQGSRTPVTDPLARGALLGLTLSHTRAHVWRALLEAVCFGTRACMDALTRGHTCNEVIVAGGATRSPLWLQMHADVTNKPVVVTENGGDAPLLGCAVLASVGIGMHGTVDEAVKSMVRTSRRIEPDPNTSQLYDQLYKQVYSKVSDAVRPIAHAAVTTSSKK